MNKKINKLLLLGLASIALASCGGSGSSEGEKSSSSIPAVSSEEVVVSSEESEIPVDDVPVATGKYLAANIMYDYNKESKTITAIKYSSYQKYKANDGEKLFEASVRFIRYYSSYGDVVCDAAAFESGDTKYHLYLYNEAPRLDSRKEGAIITTSSVVLNKAENLIEPSYGLYVSSEQTKTKSDSTFTSAYYDEEGYAIKEKFYLFIEVSETKAALYKGESATEHEETPLCSIENYEAQLLGGAVGVKIPHNPGDFACSFTFMSSDTIQFTNASEVRYDYGASGIMTKIA